MSTTENLIGDEAELMKEAEEEQKVPTANDDEDEGDAQPEVTPNPETDPEAETETEPAAKPDPEPEPALKLDAPFSPVVPVQDFDYEAEREVLLDKRKDLRASLRNGDIDQDQFDEDFDRVNDEINRLDVRQARKDAAVEQNQAIATAQWFWTIGQVKGHIKSTDGLDYDAPENAGLLAQWDRQIKLLAGNESNEDKPAEWFALEAHRLVRAEIEATALKFGLRPADGEKPKQTPSDRAKVKEALDKRKPNVASAKSLAGLPNSDNATNVGAGEYDHLDKLDGLELERALAKMSPEAAADYLSGK